MELERLSPGTEQVGNVFQKISLPPVSSSPTTMQKYMILEMVAVLAWLQESALDCTRSYPILLCSHSHFYFWKWLGKDFAPLAPIWTFQENYHHHSSWSGPGNIATWLRKLIITSVSPFFLVSHNAPSIQTVGLTLLSPFPVQKNLKSNTWPEFLLRHWLQFTDPSKRRQHLFPFSFDANIFLPTDTTQLKRKLSPPN